MFHTLVHKIPKTLGEAIEKETPKDPRKEKLEALISFIEDKCMFDFHCGDVGAWAYPEILTKLKELR